MKRNALQPMWAEFPSMHLVRTGSLVRGVGKITLFLFIFSIISMIFVPWQQTARGIGTVVALDPQERPQPVLSPTKGIVSYVQEGLMEGSYVEKDDIVLRLTPIAAEGVSQLEAQMVAIKTKLETTRSIWETQKQNADLQKISGEAIVNAAKQDLQAARNYWKQTQNEVSVAQAELADKRNKLRINQEVAPQGLVSQQELISSQQDVEAAVAKVLKAENAVDEAFSKVLGYEKTVESKTQDADIKNREAEQKVFAEFAKLQDIEKEQIDLMNKRGEFDRLEVRAPRSGYIQQWNGLEGSDSIKEGDQLFVIVPEAKELCVEMKVRGIDMPLIKEGDRVRLQFEGWPAIQFVGWPSVAIGTFGGKVSRTFPTDDGMGNFKLLVTVDNHFEGEEGWPDDRYLRQGVRANGWVLLKQVPLGYEIWRQLNGFPPVISDEEPKSKNDDKGSKVKLPKP